MGNHAIAEVGEMAGASLGFFVGPSGSFLVRAGAVGRGEIGLAT